MSVINQMLKDLDKRAEPHQLQQLPSTVAIPVNKSPGLPWRWLILLSLLLVAIALVLWNLKASNAKDAMVLSPMVSGQQAELNTASAAPVKMEPASNAQVSHVQEPADASSDTASGLAKEPAGESDKSIKDTTGNGESETLAESVAVSFAGSANAPAPSETSVAGEATVLALQVNTSSEPPVIDSSSVAMNTNTPSAGSMAVTEVVLPPAEQADRAMLKANGARDAGKLDEAMRQYAMALS